MVRIERLALSYNNVYAVDDGGGRIIVDTGPDYRGAQAAINDWVAGVLPDAVVATHGHIDHAGLGAYWTGRGVPVLLGEDDFGVVVHPPLTSHEEYSKYQRFVHESGAPPNLVQELLRGLEQRRRMALAAYSASAQHLDQRRGGRWPTELRVLPFQPTALLAGPLSAGLDVKFLPGHTPGNAVLVHTDGFLFSGDQLLPGITPTPSIQAAPHPWTNGWRFHSLPEFVKSLRTLSAIQFVRCYPGHGEPFDNVNEVIALNLAQVEERGQKVWTALAEGGSAASLYGLAERLYPRALKRRFWQIIATVQGHLDLLEAEGRVSPASDETVSWSVVR